MELSGLKRKRLHQDVRTRSGLGDIPSALLLQVVGYLWLDLPQWVTFRLVCQDWHTVSITAGWVAMLRAFSTPTTICHVIKAIPTVRSLRFQDGGPLQLEPLFPLTALQHLELTCSLLGGTTGLERLTTLRSLRICSQFPGPATDLAGLRALSGLRELDLQQCLVSDSWLENLATLQLTALFLPATITDNGLERISHMTSLELLHLQCWLVTNQTLSMLSRLIALKSLDFLGTRVTTDGLQTLQAFPALQHLAIPGLSSPSIDYSKWPTLPSLSTLDLSYSFVASLEFVSKLTSLSDLDLQNCSHLTDTGLAAVCCLPLLEKLNLHGCTSITDVGLYALTEGDNLAHSLRELDVTYCAVGDDSVAALSKLSKLELLSFNWDCTRITARGVASLKARTPAPSTSDW